MRNHSTFVILIAVTAVGAFAPRPGPCEEMQPIHYPAEPIVTEHQITLHGETVQYTAHVGFLPIRQATSGVTEGHLFYVYYSKNGVTD